MKLAMLVIPATVSPATSLGHGQEQIGNAATKRPDFEVASIKPTSPTGGGAIPIDRNTNPAPSCSSESQPRT